MQGFQRSFLNPTDRYKFAQLSFSLNLFSCKSIVVHELIPSKIEISSRKPNCPRASGRMCSQSRDRREEWRPMRRQYFQHIIKLNVTGRAYRLRSKWNAILTENTQVLPASKEDSCSQTPFGVPKWLSENLINSQETVPKHSLKQTQENERSVSGEVDLSLHPKPARCESNFYHREHRPLPMPRVRSTQPQCTLFMLLLLRLLAILSCKQHTLGVRVTTPGLKLPPGLATSRH